MAARRTPERAEIAVGEVFFRKCHSGQTLFTVYKVPPSADLCVLPGRFAFGTLGPFIRHWYGMG